MSTPAAPPTLPVSALEVVSADTVYAALVITAANPGDGRRQLYRLNQAIPVTKTETGWEIDFGYCVVRC